MKGIIFTEFLDIVESRFGLEVCQQMLDDAGVDGIYTAVGSCHRVLVKMIVCLSKITGVSRGSSRGIRRGLVYTFVNDYANGRRHQAGRHL